VSQEQEAILRGKLVLRIAKPIKLKSIRLDFTGSSGVERHRADSLPETYSHLEKKELVRHTWPFF